MRVRKNPLILVATLAVSLIFIPEDALAVFSNGSGNIYYNGNSYAPNGQVYNTQQDFINSLNQYQGVGGMLYNSGSWRPATTTGGGAVGATGTAGAAAGTGSSEGWYMESGSQSPSNMGMIGGGVPGFNLDKWLPPGGPSGTEDGDTCPTPQPEEYYCPFPPEARRICLSNQVGARCPSKCVRWGWCGDGNDSFVGVYDESQSIGSIDEGIPLPIPSTTAQCRPQSSSPLLSWSQMPALTTAAEKIAFANAYPVCTYGSVSQATINEDGGWFSITCYLASNGMVSVDSGSDCRYSLETPEAQAITSPGDDILSDSMLLWSGGSANGSATSDSSGGSGSSVINSLYSISGTVTDENGNPLANHTVFITYNDITRSVTTDANGNFTFSDLSPGTYIIRPANTDTLIFFWVDITINPGDTNTTINWLNISWMSLREVKDTEIAELLRRSSESSSILSDGESGNSSLNDWINNVMNGKFSGSGGEGAPLYDEFWNISNVNSTSYDKLFSSSSFIKLLSSGYLPLSKSYSPIALSLIPKFANNNAICGDGTAQEGETCDDGPNNGKSWQCSADCLYFGEVRFTDYDGIGTYVGKDNQNALESDALSGTLNTLQVAGNELSGVINGGLDGLLDVFGTLWSAIDDSQDWAKQKIIENTSPATRKVLKQVAVVTEEVAKYSVIGVTTLLAVAAAWMQVMVYKSQWLTYTVQAGDTIDSLGNKFTMTERAMRAHNGLLKKWWLREGMKIKVRNRHFIEKDYLDQLKSVLKDGLEKRHYGHMSAKIDKMFAKK